MEPNPDTLRVASKMRMDLYLVERTDECEIRAGDFTKFIVVAKDPLQAMRRHPDGVRRWDSLNRRGFVERAVINPSKPIEYPMPDDAWTRDISSVDVTYVGKASSKLREFEIVCAERATWMGSV